jgi:NADPH-dependent ferric siderophore reductase
MPGTTHLVVTATERLGPGMVRVHLRGDDLTAFTGSVHTDRYVKLVLGTPEEPVLRTYTAVDPQVDPETGAGTLAIDFVVHGDEGYAGPWAARAQPGDTLEVRGPGGAYAPDPDADWHLMAGDEAALPAIRAALAALDADARGEVVVAVPDEAHRQPLPAPERVHVHWVGPGELVDTVRLLPWRAGSVHVFVHGEAEEVMHGLRPYLFGERKVPRAGASISGYWRRGRTEEDFRVWKRELTAAEENAG